MICGEQMDFNQTSFLKNNRIRYRKLTGKIYKFNWGKYCVYNAGWNTNSLCSKRLSFVHNCSAQRQAARKSFFFFCQLFLSFFFKLIFGNVHLGENKKDINMCPNHSAFTKWALKNIKNLQRTQTAGVRASAVPSSYLGQTVRKTSLWGGVQPPRRLTVEVNPVAEPVTKKQGGGVQLSALSPRSRISGFSSEEGSSYSSAPLLLLVGPRHPSCPGSRCLVPPLSLATNPTPWPLLGQIHSLLAGHIWQHFLTEELMSSSGLFKSLKRQIHRNTSVSYCLRHSYAKFRSSASHSPSSSVPQFWNCLKFRMLLPVKFPRYQTVYCWSHPELHNSWQCREARHWIQGWILSEFITQAFPPCLAAQHWVFWLHTARQCLTQSREIRQCYTPSAWPQQSGHSAKTWEDLSGELKEL